jgi:hypothetical protein
MTVHYQQDWALLQQQSLRNKTPPVVLQQLAG